MNPFNQWRLRSLLVTVRTVTTVRVADGVVSRMREGPWRGLIERVLATGSLARDGTGEAPMIYLVVVKRNLNR